MYGAAKDTMEEAAPLLEEGASKSTPQAAKHSRSRKVVVGIAALVLAAAASRVLPAVHTRPSAPPLSAMELRLLPPAVSGGGSKRTLIASAGPVDLSTEL